MNNITVTLNNGIKMPVIGFGTYQIPDGDVCERCVLDAIDVGYRMIDTAAYYGNETSVGNAVKKCGVPREDLFIISKLMVKDAGYERTKAAFEKTLKKLDMDYLDLYLIHHAYGDCYGSWRAMEELYKEGKIRAIGISNFEPYRYMDITLNNEIVPAVNQCETHPFFHEKPLKKTMSEFGTVLIASETLAEGKNGILNDPVLIEIGEKYGKSAAQVILRWHYQNGVVVIPKSTHKRRMRENFDIFDFELTEAEMKLFDQFDTGSGIFNDRRDPERVRMFCSRKPAK